MATASTKAKEVDATGTGFGNWADEGLRDCLLPDQLAEDFDVKMPKQGDPSTLDFGSTSLDEGIQEDKRELAELNKASSMIMTCLYVSTPTCFVLFSFSKYWLLSFMVNLYVESGCTHAQEGGHDSP